MRRAGRNPETGLFDSETRLLIISEDESFLKKMKQLFSGWCSVLVSGKAKKNHRNIDTVFLDLDYPDAENEIRAFRILKNTIPLVCFGKSDKNNPQIQQYGHIINKDFKDSTTAVSLMSLIFSGKDSDPAENLGNTLNNSHELAQIRNRLLKTSRMMECLFKITGHMLRVKDRDELLNKICNEISKHVYKMVWVGICNEETMELEPIAFAGFEEDYLRLIRVTFDDSKWGCGPGGRCIKTGKPQIVESTTSDPSFEPWREKALERGYLSVACFPVIDENNKIIGSLNVYSDKERGFSSEEIDLMMNLSNDISIALNSITQWEMRRQAEFSLNQQQERLEILVKQRTDQLTYMNQALENEISSHREVEKKLASLLQKNKQHNKEIRCLYIFSSLLERKNLSIEQIILKLVNLIPSAWQHPDITAARIFLKDRIFISNNFEETKWKLISTIKANNQLIGAIEIYYLEKRPDSFEGPFTRDERHLLNELSDRLGAYIEYLQMLQNIQNERDYSRGVINAAPITIFSVNPGGKLNFLNPAGEETLGYVTDEFKGKNFWKILFPGKLYAQVKHMFSILDAGPLTNMEMTIKTKKGEKKDLAFSSINRYNEKQELKEIIVFGNDLTLYKVTEMKLRESLKEKEILLKEIHHRVKNNLQVISSLLRLQTRETEDEKLIDILKKSQNRINIMAMIHETLYKTENLNRIELPEYLRKIILYVFQSQQTEKIDINLEIDIDPVSMDIEKAQPCALIVNELVSNSLKHAFSKQKHGNIRIALKEIENNMFQLIVEDDGEREKNRLEIEGTNTLGFRLVKLFTDQLHGKLEYYKSNGLLFKITFSI